MRIGLIKVTMVSIKLNIVAVIQILSEVGYLRRQLIDSDREVDQKNFWERVKRSRARPSRKDVRSDAAASDYIVYLFASIIIRRQRVLPWLCLYYLILR